MGTAAAMAARCKTDDPVLATRWSTEDVDLNGGGQMMSCSRRAQEKAKQSGSKHGASSQLHDADVRKMGSAFHSGLQKLIFSAQESSAFLSGG